MKERKEFFRARFLVLMGMLIILLFSSPILHAAEDQAPSSLKSFMFQFQILISEIEMAKKGDSTDWSAVSKKVRAMRRNLDNLKYVAESGSYQPYLNSLSQSIDKLERMSRKKNVLFFNTLDSTKQECFQCHSAHHALGINQLKN